MTPRRGVAPGTYAPPASDGLVPVGQRIGLTILQFQTSPNELCDAGAAPPGSLIIGARTVVGRTGSEVIFPFGF